MAGSFSEAVTLTMGTASTMFTVSGTATSERSTPSFTWLLTTATTNQEYNDFFRTTNDECPYVINSSDESIAKVVDGVLYTYDVPGTVTFLVRQFANANWKPKEEKFTVTVVEPNNHLPLSIVESNQSHLVKKVSGSYTWDGGVKLGDGGGGFDWSDKIAQIAYTGIPDRVSFDYACGNNSATGVSWIVRVSTDGQTWTDIWSSSSKSGSADIEITDKSARFVRLIWSGNFGGYFRNVNITEYGCFSTDVTSLDFGKNIYAQIIDDAKGATIASASTLDKEVRTNITKSSNIEAAQYVGKVVAERAIKNGVSEVVFDRGGYVYHGRVKALADAAREAGLKF
jgi:large subunit ribosomal protein L18